MRKYLKVMDLFDILTVLVVTRLYLITQSHQIAQL